MWYESPKVKDVIWGKASLSLSSWMNSSTLGTIKAKNSFYILSNFVPTYNTGVSIDSIWRRIISSCYTPWFGSVRTFFPKRWHFASTWYSRSSMLLKNEVCEYWSGRVWKGVSPQNGFGLGYSVGSILDPRNIMGMMDGSERHRDFSTVIITVQFIDRGLWGRMETSWGYNGLEWIPEPFPAIDVLIASANGAFWIVFGASRVCWWTAVDWRPKMLLRLTWPHRQREEAPYRIGILFCNWCSKLILVDSGSIVVLTLVTVVCIFVGFWNGTPLKYSTE